MESVHFTEVLADFVDTCVASGLVVECRASKGVEGGSRGLEAFEVGLIESVNKTAIAANRTRDIVFKMAATSIVSLRAGVERTGSSGQIAANVRVRPVQHKGSVGRLRMVVDQPCGQRRGSGFDSPLYRNWMWIRNAGGRYSGTHQARG